jgi:N-acetylglutamate synthase-like GNAT family acetyltransferase
MIAEVFLPREKSSMSVRLALTQHDLESCFRIRYEILRKPWNQPVGSERDEQEADAWHLLAEKADGRALGTARLQRLYPQTGQLRYMAIVQDFQGKGIGKMIIQKAEAIALENGMVRLFLQARENAVPFYLANGYRIIEKTFLLYGEIQHFSMEKTLTSSIGINS